jgi:uncharacterized protein YxjI
MFAIGDDYWIETEGGQPAFKVDGKALRIRKTVATITKALLPPLRDRFSIDVAGGEEMEAKGNIVDHEYAIDRGGTKVAQVSKHWFRMRDTYGVEIVEAQDDALLLAITVCIDQLAHDIE